ncbi:MAG: ribonuclease P protein component [Bdellovibrionota bacterium]
MYSRDVAQKVVSASSLKLLESNPVFQLKKHTLKSRGPLSLSPNRRLHFSWEYRRFFQNSAVCRLSECIIFRVPNELGHFRLGITIKARGSSLDRNKVKRRVREAFRTRAPVLGSFDYNVVIPKTKKMAHPYPRLLGLSLKEGLNPNAFRS